MKGKIVGTSKEVSFFLSFGATAPHNTHNKQTSMTPVEFEPTVTAVERPQTYALDRAATVTG
jgi:hypothetical protein